MDMDTFKTYKNDWNYPIFIRNPQKPSPGSAFVGKCVTFQEVVKVTLVTGQFFGLNPVIGVCEDDATKLRFTFRSWRFLYTFISIVLQILTLMLCVYNMLREYSTLGSVSNTIFHLTNSTTTVIFLRMAMNWPKLCVQIAKTEAADPNMDIGLKKKCNIVCVVILTLAFLEHALSDLSGISVAIECAPDKDTYETFVFNSFPWTWIVIPHNFFTGLIAQIINIQCTFTWNFGDLFVICVSMYLTSRLNQVNQRINAIRNKFVPSSFWRTMREDYNRVCCLVRLVDEIIGGVVFISFANNLFFICLQLLHTLAPFQGYEHAVYFVYSFSFLVVRSLAVSMMASNVHTASKEPAKALYDVSSATYCVEVQRFLDQIHGDTVALSGLQFFNVKRGLILSIAGTIVTYELVLMQFTGVTPTSAPL